MGTAREGGSGPFLQEAASKHPRLPLAAAAAGPAPRFCEIRARARDPWRGFAAPDRLSGRRTGGVADSVAVRGRDRPSEAPVNLEEVGRPAERRQIVHDLER